MLGGDISLLLKLSTLFPILQESTSQKSKDISGREPTLFPEASASITCMGVCTCVRLDTLGVEVRRISSCESQERSAGPGSRAVHFIAFIYKGCLRQQLSPSRSPGKVPAHHPPYLLFWESARSAHLGSVSVTLLGLMSLVLTMDGCECLPLVSFTVRSPPL